MSGRSYLQPWDLYWNRQLERLLADAALRFGVQRRTEYLDVVDGAVLGESDQNHHAVAAKFLPTACPHDLAQRALKRSLRQPLWIVVNE